MAGVSYLSISQECPNDLMHQSMSCDPGSAISNLQWTGTDKDECKKFVITCVNATDSCKENCTWSDHCYGSGRTSDYVRGIKIMYDHLWDKQKILFLCCHADKSRKNNCTGKMKQLNGKSIAKKSEIMKQAGTNNHNDAPLSVMVEMCSDEINSSLCPAAQMHSTTAIDPRLGALAALAGLSGLALIIKPCCCPGSDPLACDPGCSVCDPTNIRYCQQAMWTCSTAGGITDCGCG